MDMTIIIVFTLVFSLFISWLLALTLKASVAERALLIEIYNFPPAIKKKVISHYPHLTSEQGDQVLHGLREYFQICNMAQNSTVSMPSQVVDVAWHEFILFTKQYENFCKKSLGKFLHHAPAEAMQSPTLAQQGIKTAWRLSCIRQKLGTGYVSQLPLLFAIDTDLDIPDGFKYRQDCANSDDYCAGDIGCSSSCASGDSDGSGSGDTSSSTSGCSSCSSGD